MQRILDYLRQPYLAVWERLLLWMVVIIVACTDLARVLLDTLRLLGF